MGVYASALQPHSGQNLPFPFLKMLKIDLLLLPAKQQVNSAVTSCGRSLPILEMPLNNCHYISLSVVLLTEVMLIFHPDNRYLHLIGLITPV